MYVKLNGRNYLTLCEVEVFKVPGMFSSFNDYFRNLINNMSANGNIDKTDDIKTTILVKIQVKNFYILPT